MTPRSEYVAPPDPDFKKAALAGQQAFWRDRPKVVAFDTETEGFNWHDPAFCATLAWERADADMHCIGPGPGPKNVLLGGDNVVTYPTFKKLKEAGPGLEVHYFELSDRFDSTQMLEQMFHVPEVLVGHNLKFDLHRGIAGGWIDPGRLTPDTIEDTEALAHLDDEHRVKALKDLAVLLLGVEDVIEVEIKSGKNKGQVKRVPREKHEIEEAKKWAKKEYGFKSVKDVGYHLLPRGVIYPYALKDAEFTLQLYHLLKPRIEQYEDLSSLYRQEMELSLVFLDLEAAGMGCRPDYVDEKIKHYSKAVLATEQQIAEIVDREVISAILPRGKPSEEKGKFNPNSPEQVLTFLEDAGYPCTSTEADELKKVDHPLAARIVDLRHDLKLRNTYFMAIKEGQRDGVFHPAVRQHGTVTGRSSSGKAKGD